jgi:predicted MFS family arabinose efflux permease
MFNNRGATFAITIAFACYIGVNYGFGIDLFSMVISDMKKEIGFDYTVVGTMAACARGGFLLASIVSVLIAPLIGSGRLIILSVVVCTACFWVMAFAGNVWLIGVLLTIMGMCAASVYIPMVEIIGRFIQFKYQARVTGLISGGQSFGVIGASLMVPYFVTHQTWRSVWIMAGFTALNVAIASFLALNKVGVFDSHLSDGLRRRSGSGSSLSCGQSVLTRAAVLVYALYFMSAFACNPFQTYLSAYLRDELGFTVNLAATVWACIGFPGIISGFAMGFAADHFGIRFSLIIAYLSILCATLILLIHLHPSLFTLAGILFGLAFYSIFGLVPAYICKTNTPPMAVNVFAIANIVHGAGGISGNFLGGWFKDTMNSFQWLYGVIAIAALILILLTIFLPSENILTEDGL